MKSLFKFVGCDSPSSMIRAREELSIIRQRLRDFKPEVVESCSVIGSNHFFEEIEKEKKSTPVAFWILSGHEGKIMDRLLLDYRRMRRYERLARIAKSKKKIHMFMERATKIRNHLVFTSFQGKNFFRVTEPVLPPLLFVAFEED